MATLYYLLEQRMAEFVGRVAQMIVLVIDQA
jgi:hypothetical protein